MHGNVLVDSDTIVQVCYWGHLAALQVVVKVCGTSESESGMNTLLLIFSKAPNKERAT